SVNELAEDLKDFQALGQTFRIQETEISAITGPLEELNRQIDATEQNLDGMTATGRSWVEVTSEGVHVTREFADEQGNLTEIVRTSAGDADAFTSAIGDLDSAMASLVAEGMDAERSEERRVGKGRRAVKPGNLEEKEG